MLLEENQKLFKEVQDDILDGLETTMTRSELTEVRTGQSQVESNVMGLVGTTIGLFAAGFLIILMLGGFL